MTWDDDAPKSISEANLERIRIDAETEQQRIKSHADVRIARANNRMDGEKRAVLIGCIVVMLSLLGVVGFVAHNVHDNDTNTAEVAKVCVANGGEWKQNANKAMECIR